MDNLSRTVKLKIREVLYKMTIITFYNYRGYSKEYY